MRAILDSRELLAALKSIRPRPFRVEVTADTRGFSLAGENSADALLRADVLEAGSGFVTLKPAIRVLSQHQKQSKVEVRTEADAFWLDKLKIFI